MQSSTTPGATTRRQGESAWDRDVRLWTERKPPLTRYLQHAVANSRRSPFSLAREFIGGHCYVVQPVQRNHPSVARYTERLATVRVYLLRTDSGVKLPFAALKMAAPGHVADNYWRPGNLACDVDPATGAIRSARTRDAFGTTDHQAHPDTGADLVGERLPGWDDVVALAHECSSIFTPVRYHSLDIAILADGPSIVEVNTGGAFNIPQLAGGRGFLTDEVLGFFRACGFKG